MNEMMLQVKPVTGEIQTNFDEIERQLAEDMNQYDGIVFTEDAKTSAKKKVAELRKLKKSIDDSRKEVKALWMEPYNRFEERVKRMTALVDKPINYINGQVEAFEEKRLEERRAVIQLIYSEEIGELAEFLPLHRIQEDKWLNASTSTKAIRKEMETKISSTRAGKTAIESMQSDAVPEALCKFRSTLNLPESLKHIAMYEAQKAEIRRREEEQRKQEEERRHQLEIERIQAEERRRVAEEERIKREAEESVKTQIKSVDKVSAAPLAAPDSHTAVYTVIGTDEELQELEMAMISLGLYYERKAM